MCVCVCVCAGVRFNTPSGDAAKATLGKSEVADAADEAPRRAVLGRDDEDASTDDEATTSLA